MGESEASPVSTYAVAAIGEDRPGIVAAISGVLVEVEGNIEDSQMSILRGHFAVMLIVSVPDSVETADLSSRFERIGAELELEAIAVNEVDALAPGSEPTHVLSVYGADHLGIVHSVSRVLAEQGANITDLQTRLTGEGSSPVYVMLMEIALSGSPDELRTALGGVAEQVGLDVSLRELEAESL